MLMASPPRTPPSMSFKLTAADAIWLATAILHHQHPEDRGFSPAQIRDQVVIFGLTDAKPRSIYQHIVQHVTATQPANPNRLRMLTELEGGYRRLYVEGDPYHPTREGGRSLPKAEGWPPEHQAFLAWYGKWSKSQLQQQSLSPSADPLSALAGTWTFGDADTYLRNLREGWEERP